MRIFYKLHLSGDHDDAEILSVGLTADNGLSAYAEVNDYDRGKIDREADEQIISEFIGKKGMQDLIAEKQKSKGLIAPFRRVLEFTEAFIHPYDTVELIGYGSFYEMKAMIYMAEEFVFDKQLTIVNYGAYFVTHYEPLLDEILVEFPRNNALRLATFFKHAAREHEQS